MLLSHFQMPVLQTMQFHSRFQVLVLVLPREKKKERENEKMYDFKRHLQGPVEAEGGLPCLSASPKDRSCERSRWCVGHQRLCDKL